MRSKLALVFLMTIIGVASAQNNGSKVSLVEHSGLGRAALPPAYYDSSVSAGTVGMKIDLGWANVDWNIGTVDGSDQLFAPKVSVFYMVAENFDINISTLFISADDNNGELGTTEADLTRFSLGARYWINTSQQIVPYVGTGLGYYLLDGNTENVYENGVAVPANVSVSDVPGMYVEGGVALLISESFFLNFDFTYDFLFGSADAVINGVDASMDITSLSFNLGMTLLL